MSNYYYHGTGDHPVCLVTLYKILLSGLKTRKRNGDMTDQYDHVCLYRKNPNVDYSDQKQYLNSARAGWIDHCFGVVVSPEIEAVKVKYGNTTGFMENGEPVSNIVDEWRSIGSISIEKIVGIFVPIDNIREDDGFLYSLEDADLPEELKGMDFSQLLQVVISMAKNLGMEVYNSDRENFTDVLDDSLDSNKVMS